MKLLTHNMLACHIRSHKHEDPQPFVIEVESQGESDADFDPAFLRRMYGRLIWNTLYAGAISMGESPSHHQMSVQGHHLPGAIGHALLSRRSRF